jgi:hypothetical protein
MFGQMHIFASRNAGVLKETQITVAPVRATDFLFNAQIGHHFSMSL